MSRSSKKMERLVSVISQTLMLPSRKLVLPMRQLTSTLRPSDAARWAPMKTSSICASLERSSSIPTPPYPSATTWYWQYWTHHTVTSLQLSITKLKTACTPLNAALSLTLQELKRTKRQWRGGTCIYRSFCFTLKMLNGLWTSIFGDFLLSLWL